jgi:hypothetical protein
MKVRARLGGEYRELKNLMRGLELHTVSPPGWRKRWPAWVSPTP